MEQFVDSEKPGILVLLKCSDVISQFLGVQSNEILADHIYACKRLYAKIIPSQISQYEQALSRVSKENQNSHDLLTQLKTISKLEEKIKNFIYTKLHYSKDIDFLKHFLVPIECQLEVNDLNQTQVFKYYFQQFLKKTPDERQIYFCDFLLRGDNYHKYFVNNTQKRGKKYSSFENKIIELLTDDYDSYKYDKYKENFEKRIKDLTENNFLKNRK